ncbi:hypothetical protein D020_0430A, partial [Vibrio parahaemolyticus SBR10290]|jgi:WD repeat-containing protein 45
MDKP